MHTLLVHNPLMEIIPASYGISSDRNTAFIEMANASGLTLIPEEKRDPLKTTTYGTGELIRDALENGCTEIIIGIGGKLSDGRPHDGRSADYDDWSTVNEEGYEGLNGDLLLWNPVLQSAFEVSSMGIRVDQEALRRQLELRGEIYKEDLLYHRMLLEGRLPLTIGGGIGQSRLCMFLLRKAHIGEIQSSVWPEDMRRKCHEAGIDLV